MRSLIRLVPKGVNRRLPAGYAVIATLGVSVGILILALWSLSDGISPAQGQDDQPDEIRGRKPNPTPTPTPANAVLPVDSQQADVIRSEMQAGTSGPANRTVQVTPSIGSAPGFRAIAAGLEHTCGILTSGELRCWGGVNQARTPPPQGRFQSVAPGASHSCAIRQNGTIACWGSNNHGQSTPPGGVFTAIGSGREHSCAIRQDETIACWGSDLYGEAGDTPSGKFKDLGVGVHHNCAVKLNGTIVCWGLNDTSQSTPEVLWQGEYQSVVAGYRHSCGIQMNGRVRCWGMGYSRGHPGGVFRSLSAGYHHTCGLRPDGTLACWGWNLFGESRALAGQFQSVSTRYGHTCGLKTDGVAVCWGRGSHGELDFPISSGSGTGAGDPIPAWAGDDISISSTVPGATVETRLTIGHLPMGLRAGDSMELYLDDDFQIPDTIDPSNVYFDISTDNGVLFPLYDSPAAEAVAAGTPGNPVVACDVRTRRDIDRMQASAYWGHFLDELNGERLSAFRYTWLIPQEDGVVSEIGNRLESDHEGTGLLDKAMPVGSTLKFRLVSLYGSEDVPGPSFTVSCISLGDLGDVGRVHPTEPIVINVGNHYGGGDDWAIRVYTPDFADVVNGYPAPVSGDTVKLVFTEAAGIRNPIEARSYSAGYSILGPADLPNEGPQAALNPLRLESNDTPPVASISVCSGPNTGEVTISWDAVLQATHYRIGYVNMVQDYPRARGSVTGEWIEAFIYVDVNARNIAVSSDGRAQYTLRRLVKGDRHAFTVLTSSDVLNTQETVSGSYAWPQNPRWQFLTVADPKTICTAASL